MDKLIIALVLALPAAPALAQAQLAPTPRVVPVAPGVAPTLPPGLYVNVVQGAIQVSNPSGTLNFNAGQFGYVPSPSQPPVIVPPNNPGLHFSPPPLFNSGVPSASAGSSGGKQAVDCVVR